MNKHPDADVLISFASLRSAYESTMEALSYPQVQNSACRSQLYLYQVLYNNSSPQVYPQ